MEPAKESDTQHAMRWIRFTWIGMLAAHDGSLTDLREREAR